MAKKTKSSAPKPEAQSSDKVGKTHLVIAVSEQAQLSKKQAEAAVSAMLEAAVSALTSGQNVSLPGIGTMSVKTTAERTGVRPGTSEKIQIPAGRKISFKVSTTLKEAIKDTYK